MQLLLHGCSVEDSLVLVKPREGEELIRTEDVLALIAQHGEELALVMLPGVQYYTGACVRMHWEHLFPVPHRCVRARACVHCAHVFGRVVTCLSHACHPCRSAHSIPSHLGSSYHVTPLLSTLRPTSSPACVCLQARCST